MPVLSSYKDFTIKAKLGNSAAIETKLNSIPGIQFIGTDVQIDHYFQTNRGKLKWRQGTIEKLITHYERINENDIEKTIVYRYDINPTEKEIEELKTNYISAGIIKKERKIYLLNNVKIHLDKLENGKCFLEIEAIDKANRFTNEELKGQCLQMKMLLGIRDEDLVLTGYMISYNNKNIKPKIKPKDNSD